MGGDKHYFTLCVCVCACGGGGERGEWVRKKMGAVHIAGV